MIRHTSTFRMALILSMRTVNLLFAYLRKKAENPIKRSLRQKNRPLVELAV